MSDWRDNPVLVGCFNDFRDELQAIRNNQKYKKPVRTGEDFYSRRKRLELSQANLAKLAGISRQTVYIIERSNGGGKIARFRLDNILTQLEDDNNLQHLQLAAAE